MAKKFDKSVYIARFIEQTEEHMAQLEKDMLQLEKDTGNHILLDDMMRAAHTLKGSSLMMGYRRIAELCHKFEDALLQVKNCVIEPDESHFNILFKVLDTIRSLAKDKVTWKDNGIEQPYVMELEKKIENDFRLEVEEAGIVETQKEDETTKKVQPPEEKQIEQKETIPSEKEDILPEQNNAVKTTRTQEINESIRVDVNKVNRLMNQVGELVIEKIRINQKSKDLNGILPRIEKLELELSQRKDHKILGEQIKYLKKDFSRTIEELFLITSDIGSVTAQLQDTVVNVRMVPLDIIFRNYHRAVRDLAKENRKVIEFSITGEETELDKAVIEKIQDPMMHLLRNAVGHGIESPEERENCGKQNTGKINLNAYCRGSQVIIELEDDGKGIDVEKIKETSIKKGLFTEEAAQQMQDVDIINYIFTPGFSTRAGANELSGRGVGLDVVKTNIKQLKGEINVVSEFGKGSKFIIELPLTLTVSLALFVNVCNEKFAVPLDNIEETIRITRNQIKKVEGREAISLRDEIIPVIRLQQILDIKRKEKVIAKKHMFVIVVGVARKKLAILVDNIVGKYDVVVKNLGDHIKKVPNIAGATLLGTGEVVLILDIPSLFHKTNMLHGLVDYAVNEDLKERGQWSVLVVEDSMITRDLEKSILEAAGCKVEIAVSGEEALTKLVHEKFDLILTDVEMPGMGGMAMIMKLRRDERYKDIPVVVVSSKSTEEDKKIGLDAGANAYLGKDRFDPEKLLDTIERLVC